MISLCFLRKGFLLQLLAYLSVQTTNLPRDPVSVFLVPILDYNVGVRLLQQAGITGAAKPPWFSSDCWGPTPGHLFTVVLEDSYFLLAKRTESVPGSG